MDLLDPGGERRLRRYFDMIGDILGNPQRRASFALYAQGLLGDGERKSMEPIAARACPDPDRVDAVHQQLQHFLVDSRWGDREVRRAAALYALDEMTNCEPISSWIIDDTGMLKQGTHSVGVQRQYTGSAGKITNCQLAVTLSVASETERVPIDSELYLPKSWTEDAARRKEARIPPERVFKTKLELAIDMIQRAVEEGVPRGVVLADCFYGDEPYFRNEVRSVGLHYAVEVKSDNRVRRVDARGQPRGEIVTVKELAGATKRKRFRRVTWREGTKRPLRARFASQRVVPAYCRDGDDPEKREGVWLIVERSYDETEPDRYYFASVPKSWSKKQIVRRIKERWKTERVYEDMKGELGFDHFEGRRFPGWHHHMSVVLCCYAFVVAERVRHFPPTARRPQVDDSLSVAA